MIWKMVYAEVILIFALIIICILLDVHPRKLSKGKRLLLYIALPLIVVVSVFSMLFFVKKFPILYPLLVHLPIIIVFYFATGRGFFKVLFVQLTAVFISYPPGLAYSSACLLPALGDAGPVAVSLAACVLTALFVRRFMARDFAYVMEHFSAAQTAALCAVPLGYNILNYLLGQYNVQSTLTLLRVVLFLCALGVYFLLMSIMRASRNMQLLQSEKEILSIQTSAIQHQLEQMKDMQQQTAAYRHDMRHHFSMLPGYLHAGDEKAALSYIDAAAEDIETFTPKRYCENVSVNLLLSSFAERAKRLGVALCAEADVAAAPGLSETELCALLANGLENALSAAAACVGDAEKVVYISCQNHKGNLLILIRNPYEGKVTMEDGMPQSARSGHGFGVKSISMIVGKHNGVLTFDATDGIFTLKAMLPLEA